MELYLAACGRACVEGGLKRSAVAEMDSLTERVTASQKQRCHCCCNSVFGSEQSFKVVLRATVTSSLKQRHKAFTIFILSFMALPASHCQKTSTHRPGCNFQQRHSPDSTPPDSVLPPQKHLNKLPTLCFTVTAVHESCRANIKVSSTETGAIFGNIVYESSAYADRSVVVLNDIHIDIMDYISPASCPDVQFRSMWAEFEWENKVSTEPVSVKFLN